MKRLSLAVLIVGLLLPVGCTSPATTVSEPITADNVTAYVTGTNTTSDTVAICIGWTRVDPAHYSGWDGDCPGCDLDATGFYNRFEQAGIRCHLLLNSAGTWEAIRQVVLDATYSIPTKRLIVTMSGHGGQIPDDNGDEEDGLDETICAWDGEVRDDRLLALLYQLPPGIEVVLINDQCHSEGNFRAFTRYAIKAFTFGLAGQRDLRGKALIKKVNDGWNGALIQLAGCREKSYSYGSTNGGTWSQVLLGLVSETWKALFDDAKTMMPTAQQPVWVEYGAVKDALRNGKVPR